MSGLAVITGASSGIGLAAAKKLSEKNWEVILVARRENRLQEAVKGLKNAHLFVADVNKAKDLEKFKIQFADKLGNLTLLVNCAGLALGTDKLHEIKVHEAEEMMNTNVMALIRWTRELVPFMLAKKAGHVVNLGSVAGRWVYPGGAVYCASKHAVKALSEGLRMDLHGSGIRVTNIEPGMVDTEFSLVRLGDPSRADAVYKGMKPLVAEDIADTIEWCVSRPRHVNIQELVIFPTDQSAIGMVHRS